MNFQYSFEWNTRYPTLGFLLEWHRSPFSWRGFSFYLDIGPAAFLWELQTSRSRSGR